MSFFGDIGHFIQNAVTPPSYLKNASPKSLAQDLKRSTNLKSSVKAIAPAAWFGAGTTGALVNPRKSNELLGNNPTQADFLKGSAYIGAAAAGYAYSPSVAAGRAASATGGSGVFTSTGQGLFAGANSGGGLFGPEGAAGSLFGAPAPAADSVGYFAGAKALLTNPGGAAAAAYAYAQTIIPGLPDMPGSGGGSTGGAYFAASPASFFFSAQDVTQGTAGSAAGGFMAGLLDMLAALIAAIVDFIGGR